MKKIVMMVVIMLGCVSVSSVWADTIYVNGLAGGANTGDSWIDAYTDIQTALGSAVIGDEIWVAAGTYKPTAGTDRAISFMMRDGVSMYGGFAGDEASLEQRDWTANKTTLSGDIGVQEDNTDNTYNVVVGANDTTFDGFTVTAGNANVGLWVNTSQGGGMYNYQCSPTVANCIFIANSAKQFGGGIANSYFSGTVTNCTFISNTASAGGGMDNRLGWGEPIVSGCRFISNSAESGGGLYNRACSPVVANCIFRGNMADNAGGAIGSYNSIQVFMNCMISGNSAQYGGGMHLGVQEVSIINCSLSGNTASNKGGGIYHNSSTSILTNCILWGNSGINGSQIYNYDSSISVSYSDIQGGWEGDGNIDADPSFVRDPDDGGDGWGVGDNDDYGDLRLQAGSSCIDAGDNTAVPADTADLDNDSNTAERIPLDFSFMYRFVDDPGITDTGISDLPDYPYVIDMGAYEWRTIKVLSPNGGEQLNRKSQYEITWESYENIDTVVLAYSTDNGQVWKDIDTVANNGSYQWTIPQEDSNQCLVRVSDVNNSDIYDVSDNVFRIYECTLQYDLNGDCVVNLADFALLVSEYLQDGF